MAGRLDQGPAEVRLLPVRRRPAHLHRQHVRHDGNGHRVGGDGPAVPLRADDRRADPAAAVDHRPADEAARRGAARAMSLQTVHLRVNDAATGRPTPVRLRVTNAAGTYYAP